MMDCISVENMRRSDAYTIANLVSGRELIRRAAWGIFRAGCWQGRTAIVTGSGNNGADGFALACVLQAHGIACAVFTVSNRMNDDCAFFAEQAAACGVPVSSFSAGCLDGFSIVVDCMLGTGFRGALRPAYRFAIEEINAADAYIISADINSGMDGDTGESEAAVQSDLTVTIGYVKKGQISPCAGSYMKKLVCVDIGIVLLEQEDIICGSGEDLPPNGHRCPPWLEPEVVCVHGVPTSETVHTMKLQPLPMAQIKSGKKTIELRLYDEKRQRVSEGDRIRFVNMQDAADQITVTVEALYVFDSFAELYAHLPLTACGYDEDTLAQASPRDMEQYYSAEEQSRFGVVGIKIRL